MIAGRSDSLMMELSADEVSAATAEVVEDWGGSLLAAAPSARAELPVVAGLRRGRVVARLEVVALTIQTCEARVVVESADLRLNLAACGVLLLSAAGAVVSLAWPWAPRLLPAVPLGLVLAVGGWLLIASRLRSSGPEEFLLAWRACAARRATGEGGSATIDASGE